MTARLRLLYPFLFAVVPLLNVLARSPGGSSLSDIGMLIALMLAACGVAYGIVALVARGRWPALVVPLVVLMVILWFYGISALMQAVPGAGGWVMVGAAAGLTVGIVWWLARRPRVLDKATTFLALTGLLLAGWMVMRAAVHGLRTREVVENSTLAHLLAQPFPSTHAVAAAGASLRRDV
jgi:predicted membrane channel-forming protein YqfA (hemolysin III family)